MDIIERHSIAYRMALVARAWATVRSCSALEARMGYRRGAAMIEAAGGTVGPLGRSACASTS
jgi:hypothetical protein